MSARGSMERRNFVVGFMLFISSIKSIFGKTSSSKGLKNSKNFMALSELNLEKNKTIYLYNSSVIELPKNPEPIDTIYEFSVARCRLGKSPIIITQGENFNGVSFDTINVKKDIKLSHSPVFYLQYTGKDIGWIYLA